MHHLLVLLTQVTFHIYSSPGTALHVSYPLLLVPLVQLPALSSVNTKPWPRSHHPSSIANASATAAPLPSSTLQRQPSFAEAPTLPYTKLQVWDVFRDCGVPSCGWLGYLFSKRRCVLPPIARNSPETRDYQDSPLPFLRNLRHRGTWTQLM